MSATALSAIHRNVLIVGGYGSVGQRIARLLLEASDVHVVIAGRRDKRATRTARELGRGTHGRRLDVNDPGTFDAALQGISLAIVCIDTQDLQFAHACVTRGIHLVDVSASFEVIERLGFLNDLACAHGVVIVTSVGLAPGLTNLMAKACAQAGDVRSLDIHLLFGLDDGHGTSALSWMAQRLAQSFDIATPDGPRTVWPFREAAKAAFPAPFGDRETFRFDFPEQHTLPTTLGIEHVACWTTCDKVAVARALAWLARRRALRWLAYRPVRRASVSVLRRVPIGSDRFAVSVQATPAAGAGQTIRITASGYEEAHATAVVTAEIARRVLTQTPPAGAYQIEQLYDLTAFEPVLSGHHILIDRQGADAFHTSGSVNDARVHGQAT